METLWPDPPAPPARCARCHRPVARTKLVHGHGRDCAERLGLTVATSRLRTDPQTGIDLFDHIEGDDHEPPELCIEDRCDGWDR